MDSGPRTDRENIFAVTDGPPSSTVVRAVADAEEVEPTELPALYEAIDPDALDALFQGRATGSVTFDYGGYTVTVRQNAEVLLQE